MNKIELTDSSGKTVATIVAEHPHQEECDRGIWLELVTDDGTKPTICLITAKDKPWYVGFYRNAVDANACDLAISFDKQNGPMLQIVKGSDYREVNLYDLVKNV